MGVGNTLLIIVLIISASWYIFPDAFDNIKEGLWNRITDNEENQLDYVITDEGKDYGKIFGHLDCKLDSDCEKEFDIQGIVCSNKGNCIVEVANGTI